MANRSYLYSIDSEPVPNQEPAIKGLSEWAYSIPPSYLMLVGARAESCRSVIWDYPENAAVLGLYKDGLKNLKRLLDLVRGIKIARREDFDKAASQTLTFLETEKVRKKFVLLEPMELFDLTGEEPSEGIPVVIGDAKRLVESVHSGSLDEVRDYIEGDLETDWEQELGLNNWSEVLYYHFPD